MDKNQEPKSRRYIIIAILFVLVSVALLFWARDVVHELVVLPLSYLFYLFGILLNYTPQIVFWIILLLIGLRIAYLSISTKKRKDEEDLKLYFKPVQDGYTTTSGRVSFWRGKIYLSSSGRGAYYTRTFHDALSKTLMQLLAYRYRISQRQVDESLKDGSLALPDDVRSYALESLEPIEAPAGGCLGAIWETIANYFRRQFLRIKDSVQALVGVRSAVKTPEGNANFDGFTDSGKGKVSSYASVEDTRVRIVLKFMEEELEVQHDDAGH